ncbi:MAG: DUF2088 domain-containing protein [Desulfatitalea sp.]|nr:DUF2088 domain-containing protein [Desulfatitalea sp.]
MAMALTLPYGTTTLAFDGALSPDILAVREPLPVIDPQRFRERLDRFFATERLNLGQPVVVVADQTRLCGYPQYLPVLLDALAAAGARMARLRVHIAYGTHMPQDEVQCRQAYGTAYTGPPAWVHHNCADRTAFVDLGTTRRGTPVRLHRDIAAATSIITFGAISHHYFAGFGGGRKLIFPGLGEKTAIHANHGLFLDRAGRCLSAGCQPGRLAGNPLAEDLAAYETFRPADLAIHGILDSHGQVCDLRVGRGADHFLSACTQHAQGCTVSGGPYDLVLAGCGGFPKDINLIQSHKAIHHAAAFVRDGGRLIVLAHCGGGVGSDTFLPWFALGSWEAAFDRLSANYVGNGGTALAMMAKTRRIRIGLVTTLAPHVVTTIGCDPLCVEKARTEVLAHRGSLAVIPNASRIVPEESATP